MGLFGRLRDWVRGHKKASAAILGGIVALVPERYLDDERRRSVVELVIAFIVGQGVADAGKEKAKIEAAAACRADEGVPASERPTPHSIPVRGG